MKSEKSGFELATKKESSNNLRAKRAKGFLV